MMRRAEIPQCDVRLALEPLFKRERDVRLAYTRLAREHDDSTFALRSVLPPAQQQLDLLFNAITPHMSSGSNRAARAAEPTRSQNITVRKAALGFGTGRSSGIKLRDRTQHFAAMPKRNAKVLEVLLGQMSDNRELNGVVGERLVALPIDGVLHHTRSAGSAHYS